MKQVTFSRKRSKLPQVCHEDCQARTCLRWKKKRKKIWAKSATASTTRKKIPATIRFGPWMQRRLEKSSERSPSCRESPKKIMSPRCLDDGEASTRGYVTARRCQAEYQHMRHREIEYSIHIFYNSYLLLYSLCSRILSAVGLYFMFYRSST